MLAQFGIKLRVGLVVPDGLDNRAETLAFEALWCGVRESEVNQVVGGYVPRPSSNGDALLTLAKRFRAGRKRARRRLAAEYDICNTKVRAVREGRGRGGELQTHAGV